MILVIGELRAKPESLDELLALGCTHSERSRAEHGCLAHNVHRDAEDPLRIVFVEQWQSPAALHAHFAVPASGEFVAAARGLSDGEPRMDVYEAVPAAL
ncbi:MAG: putative quinol monooxygenase [Solirubrobacteraceae bacterium]